MKGLQGARGSGSEQGGRGDYRSESRGEGVKALVKLSEDNKKEEANVRTGLVKASMIERGRKTLNRSVREDKSLQHRKSGGGVKEMNFFNVVHHGDIQVKSLRYYMTRT